MDTTVAPDRLGTRPALAALAVICGGAALGTVLLDARAPAPLGLATFATLALLLAPLAAPALAGPRALIAWSLALAGAIAATAMLLVGPPPASLVRAVPLIAALAAATHGAMASARAPSRDLYARLAAAAAVALAAALPLWLAPAATAAGGGWLADASLLASPLVQLAVATDFDVLRSRWLYAHSELGSIRFDYPGILAVAGLDVALAALPWLARWVCALGAASAPRPSFTRSAVP